MLTGKRVAIAVAFAVVAAIAWRRAPSASSSATASEATAGRPTRHATPPLAETAPGPVAAEQRRQRATATPSADLVSPLDRMEAIRQDVHLLEMQRLDARERGDHDTEARLDREIAAARAEHDRLRASQHDPEGI